MLTAQQVKTTSVSTYAHTWRIWGWLEQSNTVLYKDAKFRFAAWKLRKYLVIYHKLWQELWQRINIPSTVSSYLKIYCKIGKTFSLGYLPIYMFLQYLKCVVLIFSLENCPQTLTLASLHAHIIIPRFYRVTGILIKTTFI